MVLFSSQLLLIIIIIIIMLAFWEHDSIFLWNRYLNKISNHANSNDFTYQKSTNTHRILIDLNKHRSLPT